MADGTIKILTDLSTEGFKNGLSKLGGIAKTGLSVVGTTLGAASAALGAAGIATLKLGSNFETSMAKASTLFGDVQVDTAGLSAKVLALSSSTGLAADTIGNTLYDALSSGIPVSEDMSEAMDYMSKSANLARAGFTDINSAAVSTAKVLNAYKMDVSETDRVHKILMQTQNKGITTVDELGAVLAQVTPTAAAMNVSFEQVGAALATMTAQGTPTAQATTQLNSLFAELGKQGTVAQKSLKKAAEGTKYAGMSFQDLMAAGVPLNEVLDMMGVSAEMSDQNLLDMFGSIEAGKAALSMSGKNTAQYTDNLSAMGTTADVVGDAVAKMDDTLQVRTQKMTESLKNLGISAYKGFEEPMKEVTGKVTGYINEISGAFTSGGLQGAVEAVGGVFANLAADIAQAAPAIIDAATNLITSFLEGISNNLTQISEAALSVAESFVEGVLDILPDMLTLGGKLILSIGKGLADSLPDFIDKAVSGITSLATNFSEGMPEFIDIARKIIGAIVQGISDNRDELLTAAGTIATAFLDGIGDLVPFLKPVTDAIKGITDHFDLLLPVISAVVGGFVAFKAVMAISSLINTVRTALTAFKTAQEGVTLAQTILNTVMKAFGGPIGIIITVIGALVGAFIYLWNTNEGFRDALIAVWDAISSAFSACWDAIVYFFTTIIPEAWNSVVTFFSGIPEWWNGIWTAVGQFFADCWTAIVNFFTVDIPNAIQAALQWFSDLPYKIGYALGQAIGAIIKFGIDAWNWVTTEVPKIIQGIVKFFSELPGKLWTWLCETITNIAKWAVQMQQDARDASMNAINAVIDWFKQLPGMIWNWLCETITNIAKWAIQMQQNARDASMNAINAVIDWFKQLPGMIWNWLTSTIDKVVSFGKDMISKAKEAASNTVNGIIDFFKGLPGKMLEIGKNVVSGIWDGISGAADWLWNQISGFCSGIVDGIKDFFGIHSPSRLMAKVIGRFLPLGISEGFESSADKAEFQMQRSLDGITDNLTASPISLDVATQIKNSGALAEMYSAVAEASAHITSQTKLRIEEEITVQQRSKDYGPVLEAILEKLNMPRIQNINFERKVETPDEIARELRMQQRYGLAGG